MFVLAAALLFHIPAFPSLQPSTKDNVESAAIARRVDAAAKEGASAPSFSGKQDGNAVLSADADLGTVAYEPGRVVAEPVAPAIPVVAVAQPDPIVPSKPEAAPIVPVYAPFSMDAERRRKREWMALGMAEHGAAAFDAYSTRLVLSSVPNAQEANPLLRPFAGNASMYAAVQVAPAFFDYLSHRMMNSNRAWARHTWWLPQTISFGVSLSSGLHNMGVYRAR